MSGDYTVQINTTIGTSQNDIHTWIQINKPDGTSEAYGFYPASSDIGNLIYGDGDVIKEPTGATPTATSGPIPITESQYLALSQYIQQSDITPPNYSIPLGSQCTNWALMALAEAGIIPRVLGPDAGWGPLQTLLWNPLWQQVAWFYSDLFNRAKIWTWPRDPLILDLDGDGLETVGLSGSTAYFDFDGDGVLSKSGWVGKDDALLVWDRNNNGAIDTGAELFGDFTPLANGSLAPNGFAALAGLDANGDGVIDAADPAFAELKLWRDASQDGQTGSAELISLSEAGIVSLNLANLLKNQTLANGNTLAREGSFTRADGSTSAMGEFRLAIDTFDSQFAQAIEVPVALQGLPTMDGAGKVRELQQAAAQSGSLTNLLTQFQNASSHAEQRALLDDVISAWAATSGMQGLAERAGPSYRIQYDAFGNERRIDHELEDMYAISGATSSTSGTNLYLLNVDEEYKTLIADWDRKMQALEAFNGQYFFNLPEQDPASLDFNFFDVKSQTEGANWGMRLEQSYEAVTNSDGSSGVQLVHTLRVEYSQAQLDLLQQAYDSLEESVYASLVLQTRLKPYLDSIAIVIDEQGIGLDATALNQMLADKRASDPINYLADVLCLEKYAGAVLSDTNWSGLADVDAVLQSLPQTTDINTLLKGLVSKLTSGDDNASLTIGVDIVLAGDGNDVLSGNNGNDFLYGQAGNDTLNGGAGDDLLDGGEGDDNLNGGDGNDQLLGGLGNDTLNGSNGDDLLDGGDGNDNLTDTVGVNSIKGGAGNDVISVVGTAEGGTGDDVISGLGWTSADTYVFNLGDGWDSVRDYSHDTFKDTLRFGVGIVASAVTLERSGNDLIFKVSATDQVTVKDWYVSSYYYLENIEFADGTRWDLATLQSRVPVAYSGTAAAETINGWNGIDHINGLGGNDSISGLGGNDFLDGGEGDDNLNGGYGDDLLDGGEGNDRLTDVWGDSNVLRGGLGNDIIEGRGTVQGGAGNDVITVCGVAEGGTGDDVITARDYWSPDTYVFNLGDGWDSVRDYGPYGYGVNDTLKFGSGIAADQLWLRKVGNDLELTRIGSTDAVVIKDWYVSTSQHVEQIKSGDGKTLLDSQVDALVSAMAAFAPPAAGQTTLPADYQTALNPVLAANWK